MNKMIKVISVVTIALMCILCFSGCANTEKTASSVIGTWVSNDWGEKDNSGIILTINSDGTGSRYFYNDLNDLVNSDVAGTAGWGWDCKGSTLICNIGDDEGEFRLEYDAKNDTLTERRGRNTQVYTRDK